MHLKEPISGSIPKIGSIDTPAAATATTKPDESRSKFFYFAYGSNLSPTQMRRRCTHAADHSARPHAIARLDGWRWLICERGYANVVPPSSLRAGNEDVKLDGEDGNEEREEGGVYGVLYEMHSADEFLMDGYEGVDHRAPVSCSKKVPVDVRPREQGIGEYNKWYVSARVTKWLDSPRAGEDGQEVPVLVYVDEEHVCDDSPTKEYIARMNRGIREAEELGLPREWVKGVMRRYVPDI